ncbi:MAG TPA: CPBP family glutamic-type intramembrane protease [bacterium]|nr:CPBP family glutamic-type intramembrane protease [bacterium]
MQIKTLVIWTAMTGSALAMNLTRFPYRHIAFPLLLLLLPFLVAPVRVLAERIAWPSRGIRELLLLSAAIIVLFPPAFFLYHIMWLGHIVAIPATTALVDAAVKSLMLALTAALPEEFFFRGWLQETALARHNKPTILFISRKNLFSSALFGAAHGIAFLNPLSAATFFPSLLFGWLTERSDGSIAPSIILHAVSNLVLFILLSFIS